MVTQEWFQRDGININALATFHAPYVDLIKVEKNREEAMTVCEESLLDNVVPKRRIFFLSNQRGSFLWDP